MTVPLPLGARPWLCNKSVDEHNAMWGALNRMQTFVKHIHTTRTKITTTTNTLAAASIIKIREKYWVIIKNCKWIKNPHHTTHTKTHSHTHKQLLMHFRMSLVSHGVKFNWNAPKPCRPTICFLNGYVNVLTAGIM